MFKKIICTHFLFLSVLVFSQTFSESNFSYTITSLIPPYTVEISNYDVNTGGLSVTIPDFVIKDGISYKVTSIGEKAFFGKKITSLIISNNVISINKRAFGFNDLTSVVIPNSVTNIESSAFSYNKLVSVSLPNNISNINSFTFSDNQLKSVTIPNSVKNIGIYAFENNYLSTIVIPNGVTSIGTYAFTDNVLTNIELGKDIIMIGDYAFYNNPLRSITSKSIEPPNIDTSIRNRESIDLIIPSGLENNYLNNGWTGFKSITFSDFLSRNKYEILDCFNIYTDTNMLLIKNDRFQIINAVIYDINGKQLNQKKINSLTSEIDVSSLNKGVYIVKVKLEKLEFSRRFIIK